MTTDRAKRYAANRTITDDKSDGCLFCGSKRNLTVDHLSGDENDGHPSNLAWLCKSCNTRKGAAFAKAGIGRLTNQYNPTRRNSNIAGVVGVRALEPFEHPRVGQVLGKSERWENHKQTGEMLQGTSAFDARNSLHDALRKALRWKTRFDPVRRFALVSGSVARESGRRTVEPGEIVVKDAKVEGLYEFRDARWWHVDGYDPLGAGKRMSPNPNLGLSPEERKNFSQLGFDFPPRREYDEARAADRKRKQQAHAEELRDRREAKAAHSRQLKADRKAEQARLKAGISSLGLELQRARKAGDKDAIRSLTDEINDMAGDIRRNPASITSPRQWADAVAASLGAPSSMSTRSAATRIRATQPGQRRKFAKGMRVNPGKIPTYAQYAFAVAGYNHGKGDHPALGEIIHRTPKATRASYARMIAATKREHGTEHRTGTYRSTVPF